MKTLALVLVLFLVCCLASAYDINNNHENSFKVTRPRLTRSLNLGNNPFKKTEGDSWSISISGPGGTRTWHSPPQQGGPISFSWAGPLPGPPQAQQPPQQQRPPPQQQQQPVNQQCTDNIPFLTQCYAQMWQSYLVNAFAVDPQCCNAITAMEQYCHDVVSGILDKAFLGMVKQSCNTRH